MRVPNRTAPPGSSHWPNTGHLFPGRRANCKFVQAWAPCGKKNENPLSSDFSGISTIQVKQFFLRIFAFGMFSVFKSPKPTLVIWTPKGRERNFFEDPLASKGIHLQCWGAHVLATATVSVHAHVNTSASARQRFYTWCIKTYMDTSCRMLQCSVLVCIATERFVFYFAVMINDVMSCVQCMIKLPTWHWCNIMWCDLIWCDVIWCTPVRAVQPTGIQVQNNVFLKWPGEPQCKYGQYFEIPHCDAPKPKVSVSEETNMHKFQKKNGSQKRTWIDVLFLKRDIPKVWRVGYNLWV